jgi:hypothetical protein
MHKVNECYKMLENESKQGVNKITFWDKLERVIDQAHKSKTGKK